MADAIIVQNLRKNYGNHMVLNGLHFRVHRGEIFALLGETAQAKQPPLHAWRDCKNMTTVVLP